MKSDNRAPGSLTERYSLAQRAAILTSSDGGGTFDATTLSPVKPTSGYAVGLGHGKVVPAARWTTTLNEVTAAILNVQDDNVRAPYIGTWTSDDGITYIDPVVILSSRRDALTLGRALGELAIYSFATGKSIDC